MAKSPAAIIYGSDGLGGYEEKGTAAKPFRTDPTGGTTQPISATELPLPTGAATETTLGLIKAKTDNLDVALSTRALESGGNLATVATKTTAIDGHIDANLSTRATEATLLAADGRLTTIDSVLDSIKDTDGIKKITDQLPAGTNEIGKVAQGTKAANSAAWPQKLVDGVNGVELAVPKNLQIPLNARGLIVVGRSDDDFARYVRTDIYGNLTTAPSESSQSAFGETRIAQPYQIANLINKYEIDTNDYGTQLAGGGTIAHVPEKSSIRMTVTGASGDKSRLRTHSYYRYQAGRGFFIRCTVVHSDVGQANQVRRWGFFDDNDGLFWQLSGTTLAVVRRTSTSGSVVDNVFTQANWNFDKMDGTGPSGVTIDVTKGSIWECQFQWLGVGVCNFYINGILVHRLNNPNTIAGPYMRTAVLPMSWEIENTGASTPAYFDAICGSIMIEGGEDEPDYSFGVFNPADKTVGVTEIPLLSIRPKLLYNSIDNRMTIVPVTAGVATDGKRASFRLVLDGTLTGPSWTSASSSSGVEYDETATALTGGMTLIRGLLPNSIDSQNLDLTRYFSAIARSLRRLAFGTNVNVLTVMGKNEGSSGGNTLMRSSLTWQESR